MAARHPDRLRQAAMSCPGPGETLPVEADITKRESHAMLLAKAIAWKGRCDAWSTMRAPASAGRVDLRNEGCNNVHVTLFSPGAVATDFGLNAMHGGVDTRTLPSCQPVAEVAAGLADVLEAPAADVYSRPGYRATVAQYYAAEDVAELEAQPPFRPRQ
eukprot:jgi/Tetstr1/459004/TSEL_000395.t1